MIALAGALVLTRLSGPIVLDGYADEQAWEAIEPAPLVVYEPVYGAVPSERTEIRVAYDEHALYVGARLDDSEPALVRAGSLYRDRYAGDDTVGIIVDGFNDDRNARWFYTTPAGMRADGTVCDDMAAGQADWSWNGHWDAHAVQTEAGWSAEMRIPFATLGFRPDGGSLVIGLGVYRWLARQNERQVWPDVPPRWARGYAKPSKLVDVALSDVRAGRAMQVSPYVLGGRVDGLVARTTHEAGIDLRRGLGAGLSLDVSLNTDFAQVEADEEQINLTRFPLFLPEKRPFFLEHADIFDFAWEGNSQVFHSRRIGLHDGEPFRLLGGVRLAGRSGSWDVGVLDLQGARHRGEAAENFGVLRLRHRGARAAVGGILTSRAALDGSLNALIGADVEWRATGDEFVTLKAARSSTGDRQGSRLLARWERRRQQGLSYEGVVARADDGFEPGLGYDVRRDFSYGAGRVGYEWLRGAGMVRRVTATASAEAYRRNADDSVDSAVVSSSLSVETRRGDELEIFARARHEDVRSAFELPKALVVPSGAYGFQEAGATWTMSSGRRLRPGASLRAGSLYDGRQWAVGPALAWNVSRHLDVGAEYERTSLRFPSRGQRADTHVVRLRLRAAWDIHASGTAFAQYNDAAGGWSLNGRLRYHVREGTDVWLVYDDHVDGQLSDGHRRRSVLAKVTYTVVR